MSCSPRAVNGLGYLLLILGVSISSFAWAAHPTPVYAVPVISQLPDVVSQYGSNAVWLGLIGLATLIINTWSANRKGKRDNDIRFAELLREATEAKEAARQVKIAKEASDRRVAEIEIKLDAAHEIIGRLIPRVEIAAKAIDTTTAAVGKVADYTGVSVAVAPKMNGGHGAMDGLTRAVEDDYPELDGPPV